MNIQQYKYPKPHNKFDRAESEFIGNCLNKTPWQFHTHIENRFNWQLKNNGLRSANLELLGLSKRLESARIDLAMSDDEICQEAEKQAVETGRHIAYDGLIAGQVYVNLQGVKLPKCDTDKGMVARITDEQWWRGKLRKKHGRAVEKEAITLNMVHAKKEIYSSNASVSRRKSQNTRNLRTLKEVYAVNELGQEYTLAELAELSVSNPEIRRGELMTRIEGYEQYAKSKGHVGEFWTFTVPSRMHSMTRNKENKTVRVNGKYDGTTPGEAQAYLTKKWELIRSELQRRKINVYGIRVCEPHHDGCPHWHLLFFMRPGHVIKAREIVKRYMLGMVKPHFKYSKYNGWYVRHKTGVCSLLEDYTEKGARKYRVDFKKIDWTKKSKKTGRCWTAAGYIAKYISKNIDAYGIEHDLYGKDANKSIERVDAWASTWGIRQFQPVGGCSVTVWRELRRLKESDVLGSEIYQHWKAADMGDWFAYMMQMDKQPIALYKEYNENPGKYLEPLGDQIKGVCVGGVEFITRKHEWSIGNGSQEKTGNKEKAGCKEKAMQERQAAHVSIFRRGSQVHPLRQVCAARWSYNTQALSGVFLPPWSSVNNCTVNSQAHEFTAHVRAYYLHWNPGDSHG